MSDTPEIITRAEAEARKLKRYFTGEACPHGHLAERYTRTGYCVICELAGQKRRRDSNAVLKECVICEKLFRPMRCQITCGERCSKANKKALNQTPVQLARSRERVAKNKAANPEKYAALEAAWRERNRQSIRQYHQRKYAEDPVYRERVRDGAARHYAEKSNDHPTAIKLAVKAQRARRLLRELTP